MDWAAEADEGSCQTRDCTGSPAQQQDEAQPGDEAKNMVKIIETEIQTARQK